MKKISQRGKRLHEPCPLDPPTTNVEAVRFELQTAHTVPPLIYSLSPGSLLHLLKEVQLQHETLDRGTTPQTPEGWIEHLWWKRSHENENPWYSLPNLHISYSCLQKFALNSCLKKYALDVGPEFSWQNHYIDQNNLNITDCRLVVNERPELSFF